MSAINTRLFTSSVHRTKPKQFFWERMVGRLITTVLVYVSSKGVLMKWRSSELHQSESMGIGSPSFVRESAIALGFNSCNGRSLNPSSKRKLDAILT